MKTKRKMNATTHATAQRRSRRGFSMLDLMVSLTLLIAAMSVVGPLVVRHGQVLKSQRHYRLALDELSNQLERLAALSPEQLADALEQIAPSPFVAERLPGAKIEGELAPVEAGTRVTLRMSWDEIGHRREPVTLAAWVFAPPAGAANAAEGAGP